MRYGWIMAAWMVMLPLVSGCTSPSRVNIELRKQLQERDEKIAQTAAERDAALARVAGLETRSTTVPVLPQARLDRMFTVHGLKISRLSGGADLDPKRPGDEGFKLYLTPVDENGDTLKATGAYTIEAFDLARPQAPLLGRWTFTPEEAKKDWYGFLLHSFVLTCPWQAPPDHEQITVKVTFRDELTGRLYSEQTVIAVQLPPATRPATR